MAHVLTGLSIVQTDQLQKQHSLLTKAVSTQKGSQQYLCSNISMAIRRIELVLKIRSSHTEAVSTESRTTCRNRE